ncbi:hypothetical protein BKA70DRAFT_1441806 [Coprinopsis sp. MPI-PUGE-AT-0042]|nr:hypothetical protein BKA70DRAFT_1441806 [Coprinopsis sp. MPI-PUGE-AT-0042]
MSLATIPREIVFEIINCLEYDLTSLKSTSLVQTVRLLDEFSSESAARIRGYIEGLFLGFIPGLQHYNRTWLLSHGELLARVLKMLPLDRLTDFALGDGWVPFLVSQGDENRALPRLAVVRCIEEICAAPKLTTLTTLGNFPFEKLLPSCGSSLKNLYTYHLGKSVLPQVLENQGRATPIELEVLMMRYHFEEDEEGLGLDDYILDPRSLISLRSLKRLDIEGDKPFSANLSRIFALCIHSIHWLLVDAKVVPSSDYVLGFRRAYCLKNLDLSFRNFLDPAKLTQVMNWLLRELTDHCQFVAHQASGRVNHPSKLESFHLHLPLAVTDLKVTTVFALSEVLSDKTHFPLLKNVDIKFTYMDHPFDAGKSGHKEREEIEAAMGSLKRRGLLRVEWNGI